MDEEFAARRAAARKRLDAIDPHMAAGGMDADPFRREWFESVYALADGDPACVPWANLAPHPLFAEWLAAHDVAGQRALDVGCGLGDNAEALARRGATTVAFDLSEGAITWAKARFPRTSVVFTPADLFKAPPEWLGAFDLVHECYTLQALPPALLHRAGDALAGFLAPGGRLLVIARARHDGQASAAPPWPLDHAQIASIAGSRLTLVDAEYIARPPSPPHWRALFRRDP